MWQAPNQRVGAVQSAKKRQQDRVKRPIHLRRVRAEVRLIPHQETFAQAQSTGTLGELREARVILNDLSPTGIGIYSVDPMVPGHRIRITLEEPKRMVAEGKIIWCQDQQVASAVLSRQTYRYRIGVKFAFPTPEEEKAFREFCQDLQKNYLYNPDE